MHSSAALPSARDKLLFTPGPLTTSASVKQAMLHDAGSWHYDFNAKVRWIREELLRVARLSESQNDPYEVVLLQGSGTFGVEAVFSTCVPTQGKVAVLSNGAYGERMLAMLQAAKIDQVALRTPENTPSDPGGLSRLLAEDKGITHVAAVHCETTTGILNPIADVGAVARKHGRTFIVDAMSSFGAVPIDIRGWGIDYLISSSNKCVEGVPGFGFVFCRRALLLACEGQARTVSLDLLGQLKGFEKNGQFRFTPPTHVLLAFEQALKELELEGGVAGRGHRYHGNHRVLVEGMRRLGFQPYLGPETQSYIITSFYYPKDPRFSFETFYRSLSDKGFIIYPGKISQVDLFRIGSIGRLTVTDMQSLLAAIALTLDQMGVARPRV
ncbi:MAG TPA: 2-aminoethylphosphonate--pyruvate transaminase [Verrucomicrobiae bacterium]|nr:2-aminoethylphosphonate--pyruvate transaminase [Verrucomicrobiae bacterium]